MKFSGIVVLLAVGICIGPLTVRFINLVIFIQIKFCFILNNVLPDNIGDVAFVTKFSTD
ncbi:hypothetical protein EVA_14776 [gut metagenome]|uniref:Uncharacterized protein n=1 Tax=gut metagenome TaxID=749906 RepID=J9G5P7_9ZZZZ